MFLSPKPLLHFFPSVMGHYSTMGRTVWSYNVTLPYAFMAYTGTALCLCNFNLRILRYQMWRQKNLNWTTASVPWKTIKNMCCGKWGSSKKNSNNFFYIWVSVHHKSVIYNKPTRCNSGRIVFIKN